MLALEIPRGGALKGLLEPAQGATTCYDCPPGTFGTVDQGCLACEPGTYQNQTGKLKQEGGGGETPAYAPPP